MAVIFTSIVLNVHPFYSAPGVSWTLWDCSRFLLPRNGGLFIPRGTLHKAPRKSTL